MNLELQRAREYLDETQAAIRALDEETLSKLGALLASLSQSGGTLWTMGNGGSASTASHMSCDIGKGVSCSYELPIRAICINDLMATQSAWGNDFGFDEALKNNLEQLARPGDVVLAMSGSGKSANVVNAAQWARANGCTVVALVGSKPGPLSDAADLVIHVASDDMQVIENVHLVIDHWLYKALAR